MEKQRSYSFKRTKFLALSLTVSICIIFLTFFSFWVFKNDPLIINPETRFQFTEIGSTSPSFVRKPFSSNSSGTLSQTHFDKPFSANSSVSLNQTHFDNALNVSETPAISFNFDEFQRNSSGNGLPKLDSLRVLDAVNSVNGTNFSHFHVDGSVRNGKKSGLLAANNTNRLFLKPISEELHKFEQEKGETLCDVSKGKWIFDESYPVYSSFTCPFIDEGFNCEANGRLDKDYMKWRWQPQDCDIPRFNATNMLELIRGKRLVFVGDSINRNQWESMLCLLTSVIKDPKKVYETHGRHITKDKGNYCFKFVDYKCTVEYYVSHFLVHESKARVGKKRIQTLRIDTIDKGSSRWKGADVLIFNTAHWWSHYKTKSGVNYYQEGDTVVPHLDSLTAFSKSMMTWASWVDKYINPRKTQVIFRSSAPSHFRGGQWNSGGHCNEASRPLNQTTTENYPQKNVIAEEVIKQMKTRVNLLNITNLSDYRIDGHPSIYGKRKGSSVLKGEDCSHWCLPGVPDVWNQILYVHIRSTMMGLWAQKEKKVTVLNI